jgi:hypothetical protein
MAPPRIAARSGQGDLEVVRSVRAGDVGGGLHLRDKGRRVGGEDEDLQGSVKRVGNGPAKL